jgi:hypothetical protein
MVKIFQRTFLVCITLTLAFSFKSIAQGGDPGDQKLNTLVRDFCKKNTPVFDKIDAWIKSQKGNKPALTAPPAVEYDCSECGTENHKNVNVNKIDAYIKQLGKPESGYISQLIDIEHQLLLLTGDHPDYNSLPKDILNCITHLSQEAIEKDIKTLMNRIFDDKVKETYYKFSNETKYAWALINTLSYYIRYYIAVVGYSHSSSSGNGSTEIKDDRGYINMQIADDLLASLYEKNYLYYKDQLFKQYHYNIYPNLMPLSRDYLLEGGHDNKLENDVVGYINEGISFMHFKLKLTFEETGPEWHYTMKGETLLRCNLVPDTAFYTWCYVFEPTNGKGLTMKMDNVAITPPGATADYTGPNETDNPFIIRVNLCNGSPVLHLIFTTFGIKGQMIVHADGKDITGPAPWQPMGYFAPDLASAQKKLAEQKDLANDFKSHESEYKAAMQEWAAHRNDPGFKNTSQGKKDIALIMQFQHQTGVQTPYLNGYTGQKTPSSSQNMDQYKQMQAKINEMKKKSAGDPNYEGQQKDMQEIQDMQKAIMQNSSAANVTDNNKLMTFDLPLHFSKQAINYENSADAGGKIHYHVIISMEEIADNRDNIQPLNK